MKPTARSIAAMAAALMALTPLLGGCAGLGDSTANEQFVDGGAQTTARDWQAVADAITADGKVTRAETEQVITEYWNCMAINGFSGTYAIDLDVYHWSFLGSYGLNTDIVGDDGTPDISGMDAEESQRVLAEWNRSKEGQAAFNRYVKLMGERKAPCQPLGDVEDVILSSIDWDYYQRNKFDAIQRCIAANAPTYADRARRVQYPTGPDADGEYQLIKEFGLYGESSPDGDKFMYAKAGTEEHRLRQCFNNPNGVPIVPFGADETLHDTGQPEG